MKFENLNFLEPSGPLQACNGTASTLPYLHMKGRCLRIGLDPLIARHSKVTIQWASDYSRSEALTAKLMKIKSSVTLSSVDWYIFIDILRKHSASLLMDLQAIVFRLLDRANWNVFSSQSKNLGVYVLITLLEIFKKQDGRVWSKFVWINATKASGELQGGTPVPSPDFDVIYFFIFLIR